MTGSKWWEWLVFPAASILAGLAIWAMEPKAGFLTGQLYALLALLIIGGFFCLPQIILDVLVLLVRAVRHRLAKK